MQTPFDATIKEIVAGAAMPWAALLRPFVRLPLGAATIVDSALTGVSFAVDVVLWIGTGADSEIAHLEFESGWAGDIAARLAAVNALLNHRLNVPVASVVLLLRPPANSPQLTGTYVVNSPTGVERFRFNYTIIRVWELPAADLLAAGPALAILAPLTNDAYPDPTAIVRQVSSQVRAALPTEKAHDLLTGMFVLMGLRYNDAIITPLMREVMNLRESSTYQIIYREGRDEGMMMSYRNTILRQGSRRFAAPAPETSVALAAIVDVGRLERMVDRIADAVSWDDLLDTP